MHDAFNEAMSAVLCVCKC